MLYTGIYVCVDIFPEYGSLIYIDRFLFRGIEFSQLMNGYSYGRIAYASSVWRANIPRICKLVPRSCNSLSVTVSYLVEWISTTNGQVHNLIPWSGCQSYWPMARGKAPQFIRDVIIIPSYIAFHTFETRNIGFAPGWNIQGLPFEEP